jgi:maleate isomerase
VAYHLGREVVRSVSDVDGLFISCTNFRTFEIIESLSLDLGKPVITSNQASLWMALKMGGIPSSLWGLTS